MSFDFDQKWAWFCFENSDFGVSGVSGVLKKLAG